MLKLFAFSIGIGVGLFFVLSNVYPVQYKCVYSDWMGVIYCKDNSTRDLCSQVDGEYLIGACDASDYRSEQKKPKYTGTQASCLEKCASRCTLLSEYERKSCVSSCRAQCGIYD